LTHHPPDGGVELGQVDVLGRIGSAISTVGGDVLSLLERLARELGFSAIVMMRPRRRSVIAECAWFADGWRSRRVTVPATTRSTIESLAAVEVVELGAAVAEVPLDPQWEAAWAATDALAIGVAPERTRIATADLIVLATSLDVFLARERSYLASRMNGVLRERARIASVIHGPASKECATVGIQLDVLEGMVKVMRPALDLVGDIKTSTGVAMETLRTAAFTPTSVPPLGVWTVDDLGQFVEDCAKAHALDVTFETVGLAELLDNENIDLVFAFVQEGFGDIRRYSENHRGAVRATFHDGSLRLTISNGHADEGSSDDGANGHVRRLMRSWARLLGGDITIERSNGDVASTTLAFPL
jgi:signal transduction histidine kinase